MSRKTDTVLAIVEAYLKERGTPADTSAVMRHIDSVNRLYSVTNMELGQIIKGSRHIKHVKKYGAHCRTTYQWSE